MQLRYQLVLFDVAKGVYKHEYIDDYEKVIETSLHEKEDYYNSLNMEDITDAD